MQYCKQKKNLKTIEKYIVIFVAIENEIYLNFFKI